MPKSVPPHREKLQAYYVGGSVGQFEAPLPPAAAHELAAKLAWVKRIRIELRDEHGNVRATYGPDQDRRKA